MVGTIPEGQHLPDESVSSSESPSRFQAITACCLSHISTWWTLRHILEYGQRNSLSSCPNYPTPVSPSLGVNLVSPPNTRSSEAATGHHSLMCTLPHTSDIHYVLAILSLKCLLNLPPPPTTASSALFLHQLWTLPQTPNVPDPRFLHSPYSYASGRSHYRDTRWTVPWQWTLPDHRGSQVHRAVLPQALSPSWISRCWGRRLTWASSSCGHPQSRWQKEGDGMGLL